MSTEIDVRRIYDPPADDDGVRILVDRLWPRGVSKAAARIDHWPREVSPSDALRKWYQHDPAKWDEFRARFFDELDAMPDAVRALVEYVRDRKVTFLFGSKEPRLNNAHALKAYIERTLGDAESRA